MYQGASRDLRKTGQSACKPERFECLEISHGKKKKRRRKMEGLIEEPGKKKGSGPLEKN